MTDLMADRGPDAQDIWMDGNVGVRHTTLRTTSKQVSPQSVVN
jgi:asparagine synthetase B (glutamine-hydrolysing)